MITFLCRDKKKKRSAIVNFHQLLTTNQSSIWLKIKVHTVLCLTMTVGQFKFKYTPFIFSFFPRDLLLFYL